MKHATLITLFFVAAIIALAAYLKNPVILLALSFCPTLIQDLPFGLLAQTGQQSLREAEFDGEDEPQPIGFTQDVKSKT